MQITRRVFIIVDTLGIEAQTRLKSLVINKVRMKYEFRHHSWKSNRCLKKKLKTNMSDEVAKKEIHVEGLPYTWTEAEMKSHFASCGDIESIRMPTWQDSGRSKGYGFITFTATEAVEEALKLDKSEIEGRWLKVAVANGARAEGERAPRSLGKMFASEPEEGCKCLFIKNLPYEATEDQVGDLFKQYGDVASIRVPVDQGRAKGFAFIEFEDAKSIKNIVQAAEKEMKWTLGERDLFLDYGNGKPKAGFHARPDSYNSRFSNSRSPGGIDKRGGKGGFGKGKGKGKGFGKGKGKGYKGSPRGHRD